MKIDGTRRIRDTSVRVKQREFQMLVRVCRSVLVLASKEAESVSMVASQSAFSRIDWCVEQVAHSPLGCEG